MHLTFHQINEVISRGEKLYEGWTSIYCPYFKEEIFFNVQGLKHLKFKRDTQARVLNDQYMRFRLLHFAPEVLRLSNTLQGVWYTKHFERIRRHGKTETVMLSVTYYEFIAVMEEKRVKVIVKEVEGGQKFFWSLIPFWGTEKNNPQKRRLFNGNPEED